MVISAKEDLDRFKATRRTEMTPQMEVLLLSDFFSRSSSGRHLQDHRSVTPFGLHAMSTSELIRSEHRRLGRESRICREPEASPRLT